jgi:hydroxymethylpyrimidine/phosphomethylpyrimidine kinase
MKILLLTIKSLSAGEKHSFSKSLIVSGQVFGIGCSFTTSVNDKLGINIDIDDAINISEIQYDAYMYVNGYLTM